MTFREKSAWTMAVVLWVSGIWYLTTVIEAWGGDGAAPSAWTVMPFVFLVIVASIVAQVVLAIGDPRNAEAPADERERPIIDRAGNWSGLVLAAGVVTGIILYMGHGDGNLLFHSVMGSLIVSSIAEYGFQIVLMRRGYA